MSTSHLSFTVTGLQPFKTYHFAVQAVNSMGLSPSSAPVAVRTGEDSKFLYYTDEREREREQE